MSDLDSIAAHRAYALGMQAQALIATGDDHTYFNVLFALEPNIERFAVHKNIPIPPRVYLCLAAKALDGLSKKQIAGVHAMKRVSWLDLEYWINRTLDVFATTQMAYIVFELQGVEPPAPEAMVVLAESWLGNPSESEITKVKIWPEIAVAAEQHLEALREAADA